MEAELRTELQCVRSERLVHGTAQFELVARAQLQSEATQLRKVRRRRELRMEATEREREDRVVLPTETERRVAEQFINQDFGVVDARVHREGLLGDVEHTEHVQIDLDLGVVDLWKARPELTEDRDDRWRREVDRDTEVEGD